MKGYHRFAESGGRTIRRHGEANAVFVALHPFRGAVALRCGLVFGIEDLGRLLEALADRQLAIMGSRRQGHMGWTRGR